MKKTTLFLAIILIALRSFGQQFEEPKLSVTDFEKVKLNVGADFALQYQAIDHHASTAKLIELGSNFNLPTANLNLNAMLAPVSVNADGLASLGILPVAHEKNAKLYDANKFATICRLISEHVMAQAFKKAA